MAQFERHPIRLEHTLFDGQVQVPPGKQRVYSLSTDSKFEHRQIAASVQAAGGSGNDIRVIGARGSSIIYDSGQRRSVQLSVDISEPGEYSVIFDNKFSILSRKVVAGRISLVHWAEGIVKDVTIQE